MRKRLNFITEAAKIMSEKVTAIGHPGYLRRRNMELTAELAAARRETQTLGTEVADLRKLLKDTKVAVTRLNARKDARTRRETPASEKGRSSQQRDSSASVGARERRVVDSPRSATSDVVLRPPLKGVSQPISNSADLTSAPLAEKSEMDKLLTQQIERLVEQRAAYRREIKETAVREPRGIPRIIVNVQYVPPNMEVNSGVVNKPDASKWETALSKRQLKKKRKQEQAQLGTNGLGVQQPSATAQSALEPPPMTGGSGVPRQERAQEQRWETPRVTRRGPCAPRTVAVSIKVVGEGVSYADTLRKARDNIALEDLHILKSRVRKAANGSMLVEIPGKNNGEKADKLKDALVRVLGENAVVTH